MPFMCPSLRAGLDVDKDIATGQLGSGYAKGN